LGFKKLQLWGVSNDVISPPESLDMCVDGGVLEHQTLMVHHTSLGFSRSRGQPTSGYSRLGDRPTHYTVDRVVDVLISWTFNQQSKIVGWWIDQPNNRLRVGHVDGWVENPCRANSIEQIWHGVNSNSRRLHVDKIFQFYGSWLDLEDIKEDPLGHYHHVN
jgi:hypothetical protein